MLPTLRSPRLTSRTRSPVTSLLRDVDALQRSLLSDAFGDTWPTPGDGRWMPAIDLEETSEELVLTAELPGLSPDDIEITVEEGLLTLRGEKTVTTAEAGEGDHHVRERAHGVFRRAFRLPSNVDTDAISAEYSNGVLTCRMPRTSSPGGRTIEVRAAS